MAEIQNLGTMPIWSETEPNYCGLVGIGRSLGYRAARSGSVPIHRVGGRVLVAVPALLRMLNEGA